MRAGARESPGRPLGWQPPGPSAVPGVMAAPSLPRRRPSLPVALRLRHSRKRSICIIPVFVLCPTWRGQARVLWKRVRKLCEWKEPRAPEVRLLFDDVRAAPAVLTFLRDMQVGRTVPRALRRRRAGEDGREVDREGEEGGPGPP